ncbi:type VII secretion protein EccB [Streptomyces niger]|uniref:type VII secretion protein EccB n=1 Tax=Streptomyces niger TaxID=66373 RepID=UPI00069A4263|nr:type VII secretion protein EccB [Streptomyces niger]
MASRREEFSAYTFARKRTIAAFLQPSSGVTEEGAPRPLRSLLPGLVAGALVVIGFGAWGAFRPVAPQGWSKPGAHVIVGTDSTSRYVVLGTDKKSQLHPVLNLASAKLLMQGNGDADIIRVQDSELDNGKLQRGPTVGIPYAPDRMPTPEDAGTRKDWAVCEQPSANGRSTQRAVFLFADREAGRVEGRNRLHGGQALYVRSKAGERYLVDPHGMKYVIGGAQTGQQAGAAYNSLLRALFKDGAQPQLVSDEWLHSLGDGKPIDFPVVPGTVGTNAGIPSLGDANRVGMVLEARSGVTTQNYVVLQGRVARVSEFVARLLLGSPQLTTLGQEGTAVRVNAPDFTSNGDEFYAAKKWPTHAPRQANSGEAGTDTAVKDTVCSILTGVKEDGTPELGAWAGEGYPKAIVDGATSAYVTPGTGLLYRQFQGKATGSGPVFLVTDTGLRYQLDSSNGRNAQNKLGYRGTSPVPVPIGWSEFLPVGPRLDVDSARQPQGS